MNALVLLAVQLLTASAVLFFVFVLPFGLHKGEGWQSPIRSCRLKNGDLYKGICRSSCLLPRFGVGRRHNLRDKLM